MDQRQLIQFQGQIGLNHNPVSKPNGFTLNLCLIAII